MLPGEELPPAEEALLSRRAREAMVPMALGPLQHHRVGLGFPG